jgi:hypothetical protein
LIYQSLISDGMGLQENQISKLKIVDTIDFEKMFSKEIVHYKFLK